MSDSSQNNIAFFYLINYCNDHNLLLQYNVTYSQSVPGCTFTMSVNNSTQYTKNCSELTPQRSDFHIASLDILQRLDPNHTTQFLSRFTNSSSVEPTIICSTLPQNFRLVILVNLVIKISNKKPPGRGRDASRDEREADNVLHKLSQRCHADLKPTYSDVAGTSYCTIRCGTLSAQGAAGSRRDALAVASLEFLKKLFPMVHGVEELLSIAQTPQGEQDFFEYCTEK
ncbi:hypothetical protein QTN25_009607 [Entamoeba marina]